VNHKICTSEEKNHFKDRIYTFFSKEKFSLSHSVFCLWAVGFCSSNGADKCYQSHGYSLMIFMGGSRDPASTGMMMFIIVKECVWSVQIINYCSIELHYLIKCMYYDPIVRKYVI